MLSTISGNLASVLGRKRSRNGLAVRPDYKKIKLSQLPDCLLCLEEKLPGELVLLRDGLKEAGVIGDDLERLEQTDAPFSNRLKCLVSQYNLDALNQIFTILSVPAQAIDVCSIDKSLRVSFDEVYEQTCLQWLDSLFYRLSSTPAKILENENDQYVEHSLLEPFILYYRLYNLFSHYGVLHWFEQRHQAAKLQFFDSQVAEVEEVSILDEQRDGDGRDQCQSVQAIPDVKALVEGLMRSLESPPGGYGQKIEDERSRSGTPVMDERKEDEPHKVTEKEVIEAAQKFFSRYQSVNSGNDFLQ